MLDLATANVRLQSRVGPVQFVKGLSCALGTSWLLLRKCHDTLQEGGLKTALLVS
jgi:hypothetical protein